MLELKKKVAAKLVPQRGSVEAIWHSWMFDVRSMDIRTCPIRFSPHSFPVNVQPIVGKGAAFRPEFAFGVTNMYSCASKREEKENYSVIFSNMSKRSVTNSLYCRGPLVASQILEFTAQVFRENTGNAGDESSRR